MKQHFTFEPVGYTYSNPKLQNKEGKYSVEYKTEGFHSRDSSALMKATASGFLIPSAKKAKRIEVNEVCPKDVYLNPNISLALSPESKKGKEGDSTKGTTIVLELNPGTKPQSSIKFLRQAVTFLLGFHQDIISLTRGNSQLEVVVVLNSAGGSVAAYGLLADQLRRLRQAAPGIVLTVSCDQHALSGGYMMAALATPGHLLAAPFSLIGSIGAKTSEIFNFHDALERFGIKQIQVRGGKFKDPLNMFSAISEEEVDHMQMHIDAVHKAFGLHVHKWRGDLIQDYEKVTSGAYWIASEAKDLGLVDELVTSDEYIDQKIRDGNKVLKMKAFRNDEESGKRGWLGMLFDLFWPHSSADEENEGDEEIGVRVAAALHNTAFVPGLLQCLQILQIFLEKIVGYIQENQ